MNCGRLSAYLLPVILCIALTIVEGCGSAPLASHWQTPTPAPTSNPQSWLGSAVPLDNQKVSVAIFNDSEYVYLWLVTSDRDLQRQITRGGLTCWFDRAGGDKKLFGVHYPVFVRPQGGGQGEPREPMGVTEDEERSVEGGEMDVYTSGEDTPMRMSTAATAGIEARYRESKGSLMYGLRVPLSDKGSHPFAINTSPGSRVGIGLETGMRPSNAGAIGGGMRGGRGGEGGEGGRRGGFGRGGRGGPRPDTAARPDPLKEWVKVDLARQ